MLEKIGIIGGGNIGGVLLQELARRGLSKSVALMDVLEPDFAAGKALDIAEGAPILGADVKLAGGKDYSVLAGSEIILNTAGVPRLRSNVSVPWPMIWYFGFPPTVAADFSSYDFLIRTVSLATFLIA